MEKITDEQIVRFSQKVNEALSDMNNRIEFVTETLNSSGEATGGSNVTIDEDEIFTAVWKDDVENLLDEHGEEIEAVKHEFSQLSQNHQGLESIVGTIDTVAGSKNRSFLERQVIGNSTMWVTLEDVPEDASEIVTMNGDEFAFALLQPEGLGEDYEEDELKEGDVWINLDEGNKFYVWNGSYFQDAQDSEIAVVKAAASMISQKVDNITLRVIGSDGTVSEIALNDKGQINLLGTVLAQKIMAEDITATGTFQVDNEKISLIADQYGVRITPQRASSQEFRASLGLQHTYAALNAPVIAVGSPETSQIDIYSVGSTNIFGNTLSLNGGANGILLQPDVSPIVTATYTLGTASLRWKNIYTNAVNIGGYAPVCRRTKTVTGTTSSSGYISLGLDANYGILCVHRTDASSICWPYWSVASSGWYAHLVSTAASPAVVANTSVTLQVDYYYKTSV